MSVRRALASCRRGAGAVEFALAVPLLLGFVLGTAQLGMIFFAQADLRNAVAAGARLASIYPRPDDAAVIDRIEARMVDLEARYVTGPTVTRGTDSNGNDYADIEMRYAVPVDFILFETPPVTLTERRRVYTQPEAE